MKLTIRDLEPGDAAALSSMMSTARPDYVQWFVPFAFDEASLNERLRAAERDRYFGIFAGETLAGFFMLRGFDEGYERPSFGVFIAESFANRRLSSLALEYSLAWCRLHDVAAVMLKVHPENVYAKKSYERAGFVLVGPCPDTGHDIMEKRWG